MRAFVTLALVLGLLVPAVPAPAQDAEALRREMEQMRKQFEAMQEQYKKTMDSMAERLERVEARPQLPAAAPPVAVQPAPGAPPATGVTAQRPPGSAPSPLDLITPRQPFALYERRGPGQLLFDMGMVSDFVGNLTQRNVQKAEGGTFTGRENRFFPREVEVNLFGRIDPYAEGMIRFEFAQESSDREISATLAEAYLTLLTLPFGTKLSLGRVPVRFGLLSHLHREALPQTDAPNVLTRFFGEEQFRETGAEISWVAPLPFYFEALAGVFNGDNETAFGRGSLRYPLVTGRLRTFFDLEDFGAIELGGSIANGQTPEQLNDQIIGFHTKYKYQPAGWQRALFTIAGEFLYGIRQVNVTDPDAASPVEQKRTRERNGWYAYGELRPFQHGPLSLWSTGVRYDRTQFPVNPGREWAVEPYVSFMPSEFLRFRIAYKHTERSHRDGVNLNGGSARTVDELFFQTTFFLGAHPSHPF